jgi:hypothetical protein
MNDSTFVIFIVFGTLWILMAIAGVIAIWKMDGQEIRFGKIGLIVTLPIVLPIIITLTYAAIKGTF